MDETLIATTTTTTTTIVGTGSNNNVTTIVIDPATETLSNTPVKRSTSAYSQSEEEETETEMLPMSKSINVLLHGENTDILRNSAVKELYDTEVNYVKLLASICRG